MSMSPVNITHQSSQISNLRTATSTQSSSETFEREVLEAFLNGNIEWIEGEVINGRIDPNMMLKPSLEELIDYCASSIINSPEKAKNNEAEIIQDLINALGKYTFNGNTSRIMWYLKNLEHHVELFDILDSDLPSDLKEEGIKQLNREIIEGNDALISVQIPIIHFAGEAMYSSLVELLENYGADPEVGLHAEFDSCKITREALESTLPEDAILV